MQDNIESNLENAESAIKQRLGQVGRQLKKVDVRSKIIDNPFAAVGIAAAAGAIVGLVRPKAESGRISGAIISTLGVIGFRLIREAAVKEIGTYAKNFVLNKRDESSSSMMGSQNVEGGNIRYSPSV